MEFSHMKTETILSWTLC